MILHTIRHQLEGRPALRWILANIAGWSLGLYLGSLALSCTGGLFGLLLAGGILGVTGGGAQWLGWKATPTSGRRWLGFSLLGGITGALPVLLAAFTLVAGQHLGFLLMGAVFGLCFGWMQTLALRPQSKTAALWILANVTGASLCSVFSLTGTPFALPVCLTFGPLSFGVVTWWALHLLHEGDDMI